MAVIILNNNNISRVLLSTTARIVNKALSVARVQGPLLLSMYSRDAYYSTLPRRALSQYVYVVYRQCNF